MGGKNKKRMEADRANEIMTLYSSDLCDGNHMMTVYTTPVPKGRPRFTRSGHAYTPKKTADYEALIRDCWKLAHGKMFTGALRVAIDFYMPIPKSMTKAQKQRAIDLELTPAVKPDLDNLIKAVLDALNETAFWDDKQIVKLVSAEYYSTEPRIEISIREI